VGPGFRRGARGASDAIGTISERGAPAQASARTVGGEPLWARRTSLPQFPPLQDDLSVDTVVLGGGVTGLATATRLAGAGQRVAVIERRRIGSGTTGASTAHLTHALDRPWDEIVSRFGARVARGVADSVSAAIDTIERETRAMGCADAFTRVPGCRLAESADEVEALEREERAARELELPVARVHPLPAPLGAQEALRFDAQAELDPLAFLGGLVRTFVERGGRMFEESPVVAVDDDGASVASGACVRATRIVHTTHTPIGLAASVQSRLVPYLSYVVAARLRRPLEPGLFWDQCDPYHYVRSVLPDRRLVLIGGEDHRVGACDDAAGRFAALEAWARDRLEIEGVEARWSGELFESSDGLPYIGALPRSRAQLVATGFAGTGITFGMVSALLLSDLVLRGASPWQACYRPSRLGSFSGVIHALRDNLETAWHLVADRWRFDAKRTLDDLGVDAGRLIRVDGRRCAAYRDLEGELHLLSPRCTHMGCTVQWNDRDKTWDCPCHGGRFHRTGKVLYGPPTRDLERMRDDVWRERTT